MGTGSSGPRALQAAFGCVRGVLGAAQLDAVSVSNRTANATSLRVCCSPSPSSVSRAYCSCSRRDSRASGLPRALLT